MCSQIPSLCLVLSKSFLQLTRVDNGGTLLVLDSTAAGAGSLKSLDNVHGLLVSDLAENDVATVEPRGNNSGDEELRTVAGDIVSLIEFVVRSESAYVLGPALAMDSRPGRSWVSLKFSSANFSP
jgi:hypothetical protein